MLSDESETAAHARIQATLPAGGPPWLVQAVRDAELCAQWAIENQFS